MTNGWSASKRSTPLLSLETSMTPARMEVAIPALYAAFTTTRTPRRGRRALSTAAASCPRTTMVSLTLELGTAWTTLSTILEPPSSAICFVPPKRDDAPAARTTAVGSRFKAERCEARDNI